MAIYELSDLELDAVSAGTGNNRKFVNIKSGNIQVNNAAQLAAAHQLADARGPERGRRDRRRQTG